MNTLNQAISRYHEVCGADALEPSHNLSTVTRNGMAFLRNVNGFLAVVTSKGLVFDRIGGKRLDDDTITSGRA